jgi:hypothetical protein
MTLLERILRFGREAPASRVRICPECGMAVEQHKDWCSILRARQAMAAAGQGGKASD